MWVWTRRSMEVVAPNPMAEFNFDSASTTPYVTAPSSPRLSSSVDGGNASSNSSPFANYYTSAPTIPAAAAAFYHHFRASIAAHHGHSRSSSSVIPFDWEEIPGTPKGHHRKEEEENQKREPEEEEEDGIDDFAFEFIGQLPRGGADEPVTATADELFEEGKIRPLKLPPRLQAVHPDVGGGDSASAAPSPVSPKSSVSPLSPWTRFLWSPRGRRRAMRGYDFDPFQKAIEETTRGRDDANPTAGGAARRSRRVVRSLSPLRGMLHIFSGADKSTAATPIANPTAAAEATPTTTTTTTAADAVASGFKIRRLKDLFLFRSASEGRATAGRSKNSFRKYTPVLTKWASLHSAAAVAAEDSRNSSFRSAEGSVGGSSRKVVSRDWSGWIGGSSRRWPPSVRSPHEAHYTANRAMSEELRKKTRLLGRCLGFNLAIEGVARGFGWTGHRRQ